MRRLCTPFAPVSMVILMTLFLGACLGDLERERIATDITVMSFGGPNDALEIRKRYRFAVNPLDTRGIVFEEVRAAAVSPAGSDLSWIGRAEVRVVIPGRTGSGSSILVASATGFEPGDVEVPLELVFEEDLRRFTDDDTRIGFDFVLYPRAGAPAPPEGGYTVAIEAELLVEI